ncbi:CUE domain-containing protein 2 isoform X2 [Topomyia yanbarensis]|uniref:CUE domain-containing protein 2 isoform X2 n=1 Tax=Topomyia yanbarensis TaxID=2498891 RepID=UPI00273AEC05|nr:CUE domain-containing protein 2 isoform X2 [Topomyia yanbarensis]XP_058838733.1 CUE domain-containing protein 2 isoform X2 [Topomyia yanbarensis]
MTNIAQQHDLVKNSLFQFINSHIPGADLGIVDDIVLSYVISILEEASQDPCFDVDGFIEMMSAYFDDFANIKPSTVCTWIFQLESQLSKKNNNSDAQNLSLSTLSLADILPEEKLRGRQSSISEPEPAVGGGQPKRVQHLSETSDAGSTDSSNGDLFSDECEVLQEMFPESSIIEVKHCILIANGDVDRATQILLHRQEAGQSLKGNASNLQGNKALPQIDETELKNRIISRLVC